MKKVIAIMMMFILFTSFAVAEYQFSVSEIGEATVVSRADLWRGKNQWVGEAWIDGSKATKEWDTTLKYTPFSCNLVKNQKIIWNCSICAYCLTQKTTMNCQERMMGLTIQAIDELYEIIGVEGCLKDNGKKCKEDGIIMKYIKEAEGNTVKLAIKPSYGKNEDHEYNSLPTRIYVMVEFLDAEGNTVDYQKYTIENVQKGITINYDTMRLKEEKK